MGKKKDLIVLDGILKNYETEDVVTKVLRGIDLVIDNGEFVAIMGPSGSGKSTLMNIIGFLDKPSSGQYLLKQKNITGFTEDEFAQLRNEEIGFVFQSFNLLPRTSVLENVILPLLYNNTKNKKQKALDVINAVGLGHRINHTSNQLSGGEKQRVAIARALVNTPSIILADEPTGNLDSKTGKQIMQLISELNKKGHTIIMVTHELDTAMHAKRILKIRDGLIIDDQNVSNRRSASDTELKK